MKMMNRISCLLLVLVMVLAMSVNVFAADVDGSVTYEGVAQQFIFAPGSEFSPTDLFTNFKGVMPGDTLTEQIVVKNDPAKGVKINLYMRSLGAQEGTDKFLSQMNLTVKQSGDSNLFAAPANETAQLTDWVFLGTVYSGGEITLDVTLEVPVTMGDDFQNQIGYIDWQFKVEELPVEPSDPQPPYTGVTNNIPLYFGLMIFSLAAIVVLMLLAKRRKQAERD